jgi:hypothetical protein
MNDRHVIRAFKNGDSIQGRNKKIKAYLVNLPLKSAETKIAERKALSFSSLNFKKHFLCVSNISFIFI